MPASIALNRAPEDCAAMRTRSERRSSGKSSAVSSAWLSRLTCMITSRPSPESSFAPAAEPPRPALSTSVSMRETDLLARMCAPKARTDSNEARSIGTSGTITVAPGTAFTMAAAAELAS
eukprot:scaffold32673_cov58-Phaeocystis_antarctica.AAC.2